MRLAGLVNFRPLTEADASDSVNAVIKRIEKKTDNNDHTGALIELAKLLGNTRTVKILTAIETIHDTEQHLPTHVAQYRQEISDRLMDEVRNLGSKRFGIITLKKIQAAF